MVARGDILLVNFGNPTGSERGGVRPAIVVQNDKGNKYSPTVQVAPITSKMKKRIPTHINIGRECGLLTESTVLYEQMRAIDKSRIINSLGHRDMTARDDIAIAISLGCASFLSESDQRLIHA